MNKIFGAFLVFSFVLVSLLGYAQDKDKAFAKRYSDAEYHILNDNYGLALPLFINLLEEKPENGNLNYKIGLCYLMSVSEKQKAIPFLEKAAGKVSENYLEFESAEDNAPPMAYYYLAKAYHHNYEFDKAISYFEKYKPYIKSKDVANLQDIDHQVEMCRYGKELIKEPIPLKITNLGDSINSKGPDYSPGITADESMLIFTSRREGSTGDKLDEEGQYFEDIYVAHKKENGWEKAYHIGTNVNTAGHDASISVSADGNIVFIYRAVSRINGDIYVSRLNGDVWSVPEKLGSDINTKYWETHATLSANGQVLYFVSDRPGGLGGRDIYRCVKLPNGEWSKAVNLGPSINTRYDEDGVFIHPNNKDLYFASKGHKSMGGFDLFITSQNEDGTWTTPQNMGYPINSTDDDIFFVTSADGKRGYYSSDHDGGFGEKDIYMIELERKEVPITLLTGKIMMLDGTKIPDNTITVTFEETGEVYAISKARSNGKYVLTLPPGKTYIVTYEVAGYPPHIEKIEVPAGSGYQEIKKEIQIKPLGFGDQAKAGSDTLDAAAKEKAAKAAKDLAEAAERLREKAAAIDALPVKSQEKTPNYEKDFEFHFTYNSKDVDVNAEDFKDFISYLEKVAKEKKVVEIAIEGGASRVPTRSFKGNPELARARAQAAKKLIQDELKKRGITNPAALKVRNLKFTVGGPAYNNDFIENKAVYEQHQFVKIKALN